MAAPKKSKKKPPPSDRGVVVSSYKPAEWMQTPGTYIAGRAELDEADKLEVELELKWGRDRLRLLVPVELREKFDRQRRQERSKKDGQGLAGARQGGHRCRRTGVGPGGMGSGARRRHGCYNC